MFVKRTKPTKTDSLFLPFQLNKKKSIFFQAKLDSQMQISLIIVYSSVSQRLIFFVFYVSKFTLMYFQNKRNNQLPINKKTNRIFAE